MDRCASHLPEIELLMLSDHWVFLVQGTTQAFGWPWQNGFLWKSFSELSAYFGKESQDLKSVWSFGPHTLHGHFMGVIDPSFKLDFALCSLRHVNPRKSMGRPTAFPFMFVNLEDFLNLQCRTDPDVCPEPLFSGKKRPFFFTDPHEVCDWLPLL